MTNWHRPEAHWPDPPESLCTVCNGLQHALSARLAQHLWLAPLTAWLSAWPTQAPTQFAVPLTDFCSGNRPADRLGTGSGPGTGSGRTLAASSGGPDGAAWVVACLPDPRHLVAPAQATLLLAASRQPGWDQRSDLAVAVRVLLQRPDLAEFGLMTGQGLTCADLSRHAAHAFQRLSWEWIPLASNQPRRALDKLLPSIRQLTREPHHAQLFVLPATGVTTGRASVEVGTGGTEVGTGRTKVGRGGIEVGTGETDLPVPEIAPADRWTFATAGQIYLLAVRPGSRTWHVARQVLLAETTVASGSGRGPRLHVYLPPGSAAEPPGPLAQQRQAAQPLMQAGAVGWHLTPEASVTPEASAAPSPSHACPPAEFCPLAESPAAARVELYRSGGGNFLAHHTRAIARQRPEEVEGDYWWRWLTQTPGLAAAGPPSAWDTLLRIVCQQRLRASGRLIPGQQPVVCFSGRCPAETAARRTFRPHLRRWDYEPYGVAIDRRWLMDHGARPVEYLEAGEPDNHFQQPRYSRGSPATRIDWSLEQEFRWEGDLDLRRIPTEALFYFVRTAVEARHLAQYTACRVRHLEPADPADPS